MSRLVFTNVNLLDGNGPASSGRTVVVKGERIESVCSGVPPAEPGDRVLDLAGRTVMPGMSTCHFHATYRMGNGAPYGFEYPPAYQALIAHRNLTLALQCGYTTVVGAGGANEVEAGVKAAIEDGFVVGPRFKPSGRELSTTGHGNDAIPWYWGMPRLGAVHICDGADGFRQGVRDEIKKGAEVIKLFVTGGHGTRPPKTRQEMTRDELAAAIDAAHARDVLIRGHVAGKASIMLCIELGMDIIDHCDDMDDEVIAALAATGTFVVPSVLFPKRTLARLTATRPQAAAHMKEDLDFVYGALPRAEAAGVRMLLGDDYGVPQLEHGDYGAELRTYVEDAGLSPLAVIRWATRYGAEVIGRGDELGTIEPGKIADLLIVEGDPSKDIGALAEQRPTAVLKGGEVVAGALPG